MHTPLNTRPLQKRQGMTQNVWLSWIANELFDENEQASTPAFISCPQNFPQGMSRYESNRSKAWTGHDSQVALLKTTGQS